MFLSSRCTAVMGAAIHFLKCVRIFKVFSCVPRLKIPEQLSLPPCCLPFLSFHPLLSIFIFSWKGKPWFHLNCQTFTLKYTPLPLSIESIPNPHISLFLCFSPHFPFLSFWGCWLTSVLWQIFLRVVDVEICERTLVLNVGLLPAYKSLYTQWVWVQIWISPCSPLLPASGGRNP